MKPIWVNRHCMPDHGRFFLLTSVILLVYTLLSCVITYFFWGEGYTCLHKWKPYPKKSNVAQLNWHKAVKFIDSWVNNMAHGLLFQFYPIKSFEVLFILCLWGWPNIYVINRMNNLSFTNYVFHCTLYKDFY